MTVVYLETPTSRRVARATYAARVAWNRNTTGYFTVGTHTVGSSVGIGASPWSNLFVGAYDNLSRALVRATASRGRSDDLTVMQAGRATFEFRELSRGLLNPANPSSPIHAGLNDPLRPIDWRATLAGVPYGLFYGFTRSLDYTPGQRRGTLTVEAEDLLLWLDRAKPTITATGATTTGAAIGKILDTVGWTDANFRALAVGDPIDNFEMDGTSTALERIGDLLEAERGVFYVDGFGVATYEDRTARVKRGVAVTIADIMGAISPGVDLDRVRNRATVTKTGGTPQTVFDSPSIDKYGYADAPAIDNPYIKSDVFARELARYIVAHQKDPRGPVWKLEIDHRESTLLAQALSLDLEDVIQASEAATGTTGKFYVESLTHELTRQSGHKTSLLLSRKLDPEAILVGTGLVGTGLLGL